MSITALVPVQAHAPVRAVLSPTLARAVFMSAVLAGSAAGFLATDGGTAQATATAAGADLTRLLRLMMVIKAALAVAAVAATLWRLGAPISLARVAAYALAGSTMVAGPGLIWGMAHVGLGALLLHAGLAATIVLLWRDPAVPGAISAALKRRAARR